MDDGIGKEVSALKDKGIEDNTLVTFLSDNGSPKLGNNGIHRGKNSTVYEGGIRVPFIARWPAMVAGGRTIGEPLISMDIYATAAAAAGAKRPRDIDGKNAIPVFARKAKSPHRILFWRHKRSSAARRGDWKLVRHDGKPTELYDLAGDPGEQNDLAAEKPEIVEELGCELEKWLARVVPEGQRKQKSMANVSDPEGPAG